MSLIGFTDNNGENHTLQEVKDGAGTWDYPQPLLSLLASSQREKDHYGDGDWISVTELISPPQLYQLVQRHDYYATDPLAGLWAAYGTLVHSLLENCAPGDALVEQRLQAALGEVTLAGTIDLLHDGHGRDWKFTNAYGIQQMKYDGVEGAKLEYYWQAQTYAWLARKNGHTVKDWAIVCLCRDYMERIHGKGKRVIRPVEVIPIELLPEPVVETYLRERALLHVATRELSDTLLPRCSDAETWQGRRCAKYCDAARFCHQYRPELRESPA